MPEATDAALALLPLALGVVLLAHGVKHLRNREKTVRRTASMGFSSPGLQWFFMSAAEITVGISLAIGLLTSVGPPDSSP